MLYSMIIVAEIGTSHNGSVEKAYSLIDAACDAGADVVKFQWVYASEILHPDTGFVKLPGGNIRLYDRFRSLEVTFDFYEKCRNYANKKGLLFACSPFGLKSFEELVSLSPDAVKIASPEVNHLPLLKACAGVYKKIPLILSSGVSLLGDIERAVDTLTGDNVCVAEASNKKLPDLTLLHCVTFYPAPETEYNVRCVDTLSKAFGFPCGISDHSLDPVLIPVLSCMTGGSMIEKHITLSRDTDGLDDPVALPPEQFAQMVSALHNASAILTRFSRDEKASGTFHKTILKNGMLLDGGQNEIFLQMKSQYGEEKVLAALGDGVKRLAPAERANYGRTNRSLHYMHSLKAGHVLTEEDIGVLRTEKVLTPGISPLYLNEVLGAALTKDVTSGEGLLFSHLLKKE